MLATAYAKDTLKEVREAPTDPLDGVGRAHPIDFGELLTALRDGAAARGLRPGKWVCLLSRSGRRLTASVPLPGADVGGLTASLGIMATNTNPRFSPLAFCGAESERDNTAVCIDSAAMATHDGRRWDVVEVVRRALDWWQDRAETLPRAVEHLRNTPMPFPKAAAVLFDGAAAGLYPHARVTNILQDLRFAGTDGLTAWDVAVSAGRVITRKRKMGPATGERVLNELLAVYRLLVGGMGKR